MSPGDVGALFKISLILPFGFALALLAASRAPRLRRMLAAAYAVTSAGFSLALLHGYQSGRGAVAWGPFRLTAFTFPIFLMFTLVAAAAVLYAGFRSPQERGGGLLLTCILTAAGLAGLAFLSRGLIAQVCLWEGVSALALAGLAASGRGRFRKRAAAFIPWLFADCLFVAGAVLCWALLDETAVFIIPPLTKGSEAETIAVAALFLASALVRLGAFPFHVWVLGLLGTAPPDWNAFFLGAVNFMFAGLRMIAAVVFIGRLVAADWSLAIVITGLVSIAAGPLVALRRPTVRDYIAGMYAMQAGFMVTALGLFSRAGVECSLFALAVTPLFLSASMMCAGTVETIRGTGELHGRSLSARLAPAAFVGLLLSGMSLAGLPPLDGFVGKAAAWLADLDAAAAAPVGALAAGLSLAAVAVAAVALARMLGGVFAPSGPRVVPIRRQSAVEGLAAIGLCAGSLMLGLFPRLLWENFLSRGSRLLFAGGFTGPGIALRGTGALTQKALGYYYGWSADAAAFLLLIIFIVLPVYLASRAARPSEGPERRFEPFLAGARGDFRSSSDISLPSLPAGRLNQRGRGR